MKKRLKIKHNLTLLAVLEFLLGLRFFSPVTVLVFQEIVGDFTRAMSVYSVLLITQTVLDVPLGILSDHKGRRFAMIGGGLSIFFSTLCYALAFSSAHGLLWLYGGGALLGLANAFYSGSTDALIYETLAHYRKEGHIAPVMGRMQAVAQASYGLAGLAAMLLLWFGADYKTLTYLSLVPMALAGLLSFAVRDPLPPSPLSFRPHLHFLEACRLLAREPRLALVAAASAYHMAVSFTVYTFMPGFIATVWPVWLTPFYRTLQHAVGSVSFWFAGRIAKRLGKIRVMLYGTLLSEAIAIAAYALSSTLSPVLLTVTQMFYAATTTADGAMQQRLFSDEQRSTLGSIVSVASAILNAGLAILAGMLADRIGPSGTLIVLAVAALPPVFAYARLARMAAAPGGG